MEYIEVTAKTVNEAVMKASMDLGVPSYELDIQVISEGSKGFLGIGNKPAVIRAAKKEEIKEEPVETVKPAKKEIKKEVKPAASFTKTEKKEEKQEKPAKAEAGLAEKTEEKPAEKQPEESVSVKEEQPVTEKDDTEVNAAAPKEKKEGERSRNQNRRRDNRRRNRKNNSNREQTEERAAASVETKKPEVKEKLEVVEKTEEEIAEMKARAEKFLGEVFGAMELSVSLSMNYVPEGGCLEIDFEGDDMGVLIGKRGQTLDSLQYLTSLVVNKGHKDYIRVKLDTEDYRRRRKETLENLAKNIANKVKKTRKTVVLEPMNPYERRIIHSALQPNRYVETYSEGNEPYRHVVVTLKK